MLLETSKLLSLNSGFKKEYNTLITMNLIAILNPSVSFHTIISLLVNFTEIKYAKPKRGKTAQGVWKDIVNVNDYTQTLRMEKCL